MSRAIKSFCTILFSAEMERLLFGFIFLPLLTCYHSLRTETLPLGSPRGSTVQSSSGKVLPVIDDSVRNKILSLHDHKPRLLSLAVKTSPADTKIYTKDTLNSDSGQLSVAGYPDGATTERTKSLKHAVRETDTARGISSEEEYGGFSFSKECKGVCPTVISNMPLTSHSGKSLKLQKIPRYATRDDLPDSAVDVNYANQMMHRTRRAVYLFRLPFDQWGTRRNEKLGLETSDIYPVKMIKFVRELVETAPWDKLFMSMVRLVVDNFIDKILEKMFSKGRSSSDLQDLFPNFPITRVVRMKRSMESSNRLWHSEDFDVFPSTRKRRQECNLRSVCNAGRLLSRLPSVHQLASQLRSPGEEPYWNALLWGMAKKRCSRILCKRTRAPKGSKHPWDQFRSHQTH